MKGRTRFSPVTLRMSDLEEKVFVHRLSQKGGGLYSRTHATYNMARGLGL